MLLLVWFVNDLAFADDNKARVTDVSGVDGTCLTIQYENASRWATCLLKNHENKLESSQTLRTNIWGF